ncbi:hypothetical protein HWV62_30411 [Athelia sp. TMB]|nr:hypothetical protein HWV62_30411 [Athelia sp. TMB]
MANIDTETSGLSDLTPRDGSVANVSEEISLEEKLSTPTALAEEASEVTDPHVTANAESSAPLETTSATRPTIITAVASASSNPSAVTPHPKKFKAVTINKNFLQKNSSSPSTTGPASANAPSLKSGNPAHPISRPVSQMSSSHSRLVTTKLTAAPLTSSMTGPGWSRPSSAAPSSSPVSVNGPSVVPAPTAPQLPHAGKVIQPQHRAHAPVLKSDMSGKPVWGNVRSEGLAPDATVHSDFPTAAEVAHVNANVRNAKIQDAKDAAEISSADKQARSVEADTFRGIHLDPNAHHWDEMEEDDDNFLDGVIEFGDGRQYKVQPTDAPSDASKTVQEGAPIPDADAPAVPVSKEERFADDFDRSWPRSKSSLSIPHREPPPRTQPQPIPVSPSAPSHPQAVQDAAASRVLFNERSNRLEPYSNGNRPGPHAMNRRGSHAEPALSPTSPRGRDLPPHQPSGVQLLQKLGNSPVEGPTRQGPFGPIASGAATIHRDRSRETRRSVPPSQESGRSRDHLGPPPSPSITKERRPPPSPSITKERRLSNMGPPPLPVPLRDRSRDNARQTPPHLSPMLPPTVPIRRQSSKEPYARPASTVPSNASSSRRPSFAQPTSPVLSQASTNNGEVSLVAALPPDSLERLHKDAMQQSAERARQRRQQEEEEREKQKERARLKAAELEEKAKAQAALKSPAAAAPSESEVSKFLEDAVRPSASRDSSSSTKLPLNRPPSLRAISRQSTELSRAAPIQTEADSWRSKPAVPTSPMPRQIHARAPHSPVTPVPKLPPPILHSIGPSTVENDEDLEVIDFSDIGKFVGISEPASEPVTESHTHTHTSRPPRPVAADFFGDSTSTPEVAPSRSDTGPWRRSLARGPEKDTAVHSLNTRQTSEASASHVGEIAQLPPTSEVISSPPGKERRMSSSSQTIPGSSYNSSPVNTAQQRITRKESTMSALDDVMSRIKGAMQSNDSVKSVPRTTVDDLPQPATFLGVQASSGVTSSAGSSRPYKLARAAFRVNHSDFDHQPLETFDVTIPEPPRSPKPAWNTLNVHLPGSSSSIESLSKKQAHLNKVSSHSLHWEILSFVPPVESMNYRDFSLNDVLFGKSPPKRRYSVRVPKGQGTAGHPSGLSNPTIQRTNGVGAFGRPSGADEKSTWRKPAALTSAATSDLDFVSRSPPPGSSNEKPHLTLEELNSARSRSQPKMPEGSAVAFYRGSLIDANEPPSSGPTSVNFTVSSELEDTQTKSTAVSPAAKIASTLPPSTAAHVLLSASELKSQPGSPGAVPGLLKSNTESKSSDEDTTDQTPVTPPQATTSWPKSPRSFKDSPARAPDPEHLKAVWSQPSGRSKGHAVNSLEGIADDLTGLPFTLQDVKSDDGETPPPLPNSTIVPSRMSLHEVTRAFQQVPASSSSNDITQHSSPISPLPTNINMPRQPNFVYPAPSPNHNARSPYGGYPSPMMSHSPSPTMVYPSPIPGRMPPNGQPPMFNAPPVWMAVPPQSQQHPGMVRPMGSPYPAQMMAYPSPANPAMFVHHQPPNIQGQGSPQLGGRGRGMMPPMSPAMQHVAPHNAIYPGSPVMMHAPPMPGHPYMHNPMPAGRGQLRNDHPGASPIQHAPSPHPRGYTPVPSASFGRPGW